MMMLGTLVNCVAVVFGGIIGLIFHKGIPQKLGENLMRGLGFCTLFIGISGMLSNTVTNTDGTVQTVSINTLIVIISVLLGLLIGEILDLDGKIVKLGNIVEKKFSKKDDKVSLSAGFVNASLLFCVGSMAIIGALKSGLLRDNSVQYTKALLDFISAIIFASSLGYGVLFSAVSILIYQGLITVGASFLAPILSASVIGHINCVGSITIIALSFNLIGITKLKIMNYVPAIFLPIGLVPLFNWISTLI